MKIFERNEKIEELKEKIAKLEIEDNKIKDEIEIATTEITKLQNMVCEAENIKVIEITDKYILFDNGYQITYYHTPDCCEHNYADFNQLEDTGIENFIFKDLKFEAVDGKGFRFGDDRLMFFVPCYSDQDGYYSTDLDIYLNDKIVLNFNCEEV